MGSPIQNMDQSSTEYEPIQNELNEIIRKLLAEHGILEFMSTLSVELNEQVIDLRSTYPLKERLIEILVANVRLSEDVAYEITQG